MSKKTRINTRRDILRVCSSEWKFSCAPFQVRCVKNNLHHPRYVISVSKKVSKNATMRNKIKRQVRSFFDQCINKNASLLSSIDFYVKIKKEFLANSYSNNFFVFKKALDFLVRKHGLNSQWIIV